MKFLKNIIHPDYPTLNIETTTREAARIILVDDKNLVPLIYSKKLDIYKIPGGGIEKGENIIEALKREALEEVGCEIEVVGEIGEVIEKRPANGYSKGVNLIQKSFCYYGTVISKGGVKMSQSELEKGFELVWIKKENVLERLQNSQAKTFKASLVAQRDKIIFEEYLKNS